LETIIVVLLIGDRARHSSPTPHISQVFSPGDSSWLSPNGGRVRTGDDRLDRVSRIIEAYDGQGIHRTGTDIDNVSAMWLVEQVKGIS